MRWSEVPALLGCILMICSLQVFDLAEARSRGGSYRSGGSSYSYRSSYSSYTYRASYSGYSYSGYSYRSGSSYGSGYSYGSYSYGRYSYSSSVRYSRSVLSRSNLYYAYYYNMYFYQPYMYGPVATGRYATGSTGNICKNYEANDNGTAIGTFQCPLPWEPSDFKYCCGDKDLEYCCKLSHSPVLYGVIFGCIIGVGLLILIIVCSMKCIKQPNQNVHPKTDNFSLGRVKQRPPLHPGRPVQQPGMGYPRSGHHPPPTGHGAPYAYQHPPGPGASGHRQPPPVASAPILTDNGGPPEYPGNSQWNQWQSYPPPNQGYTQQYM